MLERGDYQAVLKLTRPFLVLDRSRQAQYLRGIACAKLERWECAIDMLGPLAAGRGSSRFPQLASTLATAYRAVGDARLARHWAEEAAGGSTSASRPLERAWVLQARIALGTSWDSNVRSCPIVSVKDGDLAPNEREDLVQQCTDGSELPQSSALGYEQANLSASFETPAIAASVTGRVAHQWYLEKTLANYDTLDAQLRAEVTWHGHVAVAYGVYGQWYGWPTRDGGKSSPSGGSSSTGGQYARVQQLELRVSTPVASTVTWAGYRPSWETFQDLSGILGIPHIDCQPPGSSGPVTPSADQVELCTSGMTGVRHRLEVGAANRQRSLRLGAVLGLEWDFTDQAMYGGPMGTAGIWGGLELPWRMKLRARLDASIARHSTTESAWNVLTVRPQGSLERPLGAGFDLRLTYSAPLAMSFLLAKSPASGANTTSGDNVARPILRQVAGLEVSYEW